MTLRNIIVLLILIFAYTAHAQRMGGNDAMPKGPQVIVYKTKKNYYNYVPVVLSDDKKSIVIYPAPTDIFFNGKLAYPTKLAKGYLLDNRGLNIHSAFLDITYKEYSKMKEIDPAMLMKHIKSSNPFRYIYQCGYRRSYKNIVAELNVKINSDGLKDCQCIQKP